MSDRGKMVMPRITGKEVVNMTITGTQLAKPERDKRKINTKVKAHHRVCHRNEVLTQEKVVRKYLEKSHAAGKLPAITRPLRLTHDQRYDLQALLRVRCFEFPFQVRQVFPEWTQNRSHSKSSTLSSSCFRCNDPVASSRETTTTQFPFVVYDNNYQEEKVLQKVEEKHTKKLKPVDSSILEGQRVNLRGKYEIEASKCDFIDRYLKKKGNRNFAP